MDRAARGVLDIARSVLGRARPRGGAQPRARLRPRADRARYAALGVLGSSRTELERFLTIGIDESNASAIGTLPRGRGVLGELIEHPDAAAAH